MAGQRPFGVTLVAIIAWLNGLFEIIGGIFHVFTWAGIVSIILGIITIAVSLGLFRGSGTARTILAIVFAVNVVFAIVAGFNGLDLWAVIGAAVLPVIGLIILYSKKANAFFS
jgi:hypothetical protein